MEWDEWSEIEKGKGPKATWNNDKVYDFNQGKVVAAATLHNTNEVSQDARGLSDVFHPFPCMPCINHCDDHREKIASNGDGINKYQQDVQHCSCKACWSKGNDGQR